MSQEEKGVSDPWVQFFIRCQEAAQDIQLQRAAIQEAAAIWQAQEKEGVYDREPIHPGVLVCRDFSWRPGIDISYLSWQLGLKKAEVEEFLNGRLEVTEKLASNLSKVFDIPASFFLGLQKEYDRSHSGS